MYLIALILRSSAPRPSGVHVNPKNCLISCKLELIRVELYVVLPRCVKDIQHVLIMLCFILAVDKSIICNTTQAIEVSKHIVSFLFQHVSTAWTSGRQLFHLHLPHGVLKVQSCTGETSGLVSIWYGEPGKQPTLVKTSWDSFRRYSFISVKKKERFRVRVIVRVRVRGLTSRCAVTFNGDGPIESQKIQTLRWYVAYDGRAININNFRMDYLRFWVVRDLNVHLAGSQVRDFCPTICR